MASHAKQVQLPGSQKAAAAGSTVIGPSHPDQHIEVTLRIRPRRRDRRQAPRTRRSSHIIRIGSI